MERIKSKNYFRRELDRQLGMEMSRQCVGELLRKVKGAPFKAAGDVSFSRVNR